MRRHTGPPPVRITRISNGGGSLERGQMQTAQSADGASLFATLSVLVVLAISGGHCLLCSLLALGLLPSLSRHLVGFSCLRNFGECGASSLPRRGTSYILPFLRFRFVVFSAKCMRLCLPAGTVVVKVAPIIRIRLVAREVSVAMFG